MAKSPHMLQRVDIWRRLMPQEPRELQLYRLETIGPKGNIEGFADESEI